MLKLRDWARLFKEGVWIEGRIRREVRGIAMFRVGVVGERMLE